MNNFNHNCAEWDYLEIDINSDEIFSCLCYNDSVTFINLQAEGFYD